MRECRVKRTLDGECWMRRQGKSWRRDIIVCLFGRLSVPEREPEFDVD